MVKRKKAAISVATMVDPTGVPAKIEIRMPVTAQITDSIAEQTVTDRKLRKTLMAERAGKITRAEIKRDPTRFMAKTIITAIITASSRL